MPLWIQSMEIQIDSGLGCPIRRSRDPLVCSSPGLIAAYHVLHRLSAPRHPPYTLSNLTALIPLPELHSSVSVRMCVASRRHNRAGPLRTDFNGCNCSSTACNATYVPVTTRLQNTHLQFSKSNCSKSFIVGWLTMRAAQLSFSYVALQPLVSGQTRRRSYTQGGTLRVQLRVRD